MHDLLLPYLVASVAVIATAWTGSQFTSNGVKSEWYDCIKPALTPPAVVFPIVWTILYIMLAYSFGRAIASRDSLLVGLFIINLVLNAMWCYWYFRERNVVAALATIGILWASTVAILVVGKEDKAIVACVLPYLGWISFAALLNTLSIDKRCPNGKNIASN
jgi:benzodiazapine receptor